MGDAIDKELAELIDRLTKIQKDFGVTDVDNGAQLNDEYKDDKFMQLKSSLEEKLLKIKETIDAISDLDKIKDKTSATSKEQITLQGQVRSELLILETEYKELDSIFRVETKKKVFLIYNQFFFLKYLCVVFIISLNIRWRSYSKENIN